jgi:hypothetical protein
LLSEWEFKKLFNTESSLLSPDEAGLQEFIIRMDCRRMQISLFMDGDEYMDIDEDLRDYEAGLATSRAGRAASQIFETS